MTNGKIHFIYVVGILSALLIGSLSIQWSRIADLANVITFALTFSSLILALIAIFQTLTSSTQIIHVVSSVTQSSEKIRASADSIQLAGDRLIELTSLIPGRFDDVAKRLDSQNEAIRLMSEMNRPPLPKMGPASSSDISDVSDKEQVVFSELTVGATTALYTALKAFKAQRPFSFERVFPNNRSIWSYGKGFLVGLRCTHRLEYTIEIENKSPWYTVTEVSRIDVDDIISKTEASEKDHYTERVLLVQSFLESSDGDS